MNKEEQFDILVKGIHDLSWSMQDAPYHGVKRETIDGVNFAIKEILKESDFTLGDIIALQAKF
ncbi:hypothetical protein ACI2JA_03275 [Alkalihalobacillus sp. NPDC078783]